MKYSYAFYANLTWVVDIGLFVFSLILSAVIIVQMMLRQNLWKRRNRALLDVKRHVYELILSGGKKPPEEFARILSETTLQQFLDITTNRSRELIFFNESEQAAFKKYFLSPKKIEYLKRVATRTSVNKWRRIEAITALGQAGFEESGDIIAKSLFDKDGDISYFSMISLGQIKSPGSAKILFKFLEKNPWSGPKIVSILENFPQTVADDAVGLLTGRDPMVRMWALKLISKFKTNAGPRAKAVRELVKDDLAEVRSAACECLGKIGESADKAVLAKCLKDDSWLVRASAIKALEELLGKDSVPIIIGSAGDPSLSVIATLEDALAAHIDTAMPYMQKFLDSEDIAARKVATEVLNRSGKQ